jgi:hypothetical protein
VSRGGGPHAAAAGDALGIACRRFVGVSRMGLIKAGQNANAGFMLAEALQGAFPRNVAVEVRACHSALRSARLTVNVIGSPINYANRSIGSPITSQSTDSTDFLGKGSHAFRQMLC